MAIENETIEKQDRKHVHGCFEVAVVFANVQNTLESLRLADHLTTELSTRINLLVADEGGKRSASTITSITLADFTSRYFLTMLPHTVDLQIKITRYPASTEDLWEVLPPHSIIVMTGSTKRFWPSIEQRFARQLRRAGHEVIFLPTCSLSSL